MAQWTSEKGKKKHVADHGDQFMRNGVSNYEEELNEVYQFICENPNGGQAKICGRLFTITLVVRENGEYEYTISGGGASVRILVLVGEQWLVKTYHKTNLSDNQGNTGGASSSNIQYQ